jgi:hypothetical protein
VSRVNPHEKVNRFLHVMLCAGGCYDCEAWRCCALTAAGTLCKFGRYRKLIVCRVHRSRLTPSRPGG